MLMERLVTCSISPGTYSQKLVWYLANIFSVGRRSNHHWTFGIRCLMGKKNTFFTAWSIMTIGSAPVPPEKKSPYSKSVAAFSSVTGVNETTFLLRPRTHAVSGELANTWSGRAGARKLSSVSCSSGLVVLSVTHLWQSRTFSVIFIQFLREPLDGPHSQLGAKVSVKGRRRPSLQPKDNNSMEETKKKGCTLLANSQTPAWKPYLLEVT